MLKRYLSLCALGTAIVAAPAMAQSNPPAADRAQVNPAGSSEQTTGQSPAAQRDAISQGGQAGSARIQYVTQNNRDIWRASKLEGVDVYNEQNEKIGDISEVLLDRQGRVEAVVIGVGGFLGIGQRDVAVPFSALEWAMSDRDNVANTEYGRTATTGTASGNAPASQNLTASSQTGAADRNPAASPNTGTANSAGTSGTAGVAGPSDQSARRAPPANGNQASNQQMRDAPARAILRGATKEELKNAPEFKFAS